MIDSDGATESTRNGASVVARNGETVAGDDRPLGCFVLRGVCLFVFVGHD
jgi:hypothetical protein